MTYYLDDIPVEVERKKIKNLHLYVKPPYGDVKVTAPKYVSDKEIKAFMEGKPLDEISEERIKNISSPLIKMVGGAFFAFIVVGICAFVFFK